MAVNRKGADYSGTTVESSVMGVQGPKPLLRVPTHLALVMRNGAPIKEMTKGCKLQSLIEHLDDMHEVSGSISSTTNQRKANK